MSLNPPPTSYRPDIDGLRVIAVLSVVLFHGFPQIFKGGFIGVDVFFVLSGYLISRIIFEQLNKDTFNFLDFYARRIKRIFPALLIVFVVVYIAGWFTLLADEYRQLGLHIAAGAGFISNFVLWGEAGYFDQSAHTKPLLHLWSLGIEEQFYIVWPLLLWIASKVRFSFFALTVILAGLSFYLRVLDIPTSSFQLAGSFILFTLGLSMVTGKIHEEIAKMPANASIMERSVYPLAMPSIAGAGAILTVVMLSDNHARVLSEQVQTTLVLALCLSVHLVSFMVGGFIMRGIGMVEIQIITRVFGLMICSIGVSGMVIAIKASFGI